jgi:hypothetical protein
MMEQEIGAPARPRKTGRQNASPLTALALCLTLGGITGCRFGNYSESPKSIKNFSKIELFRTSITQFETLAVLNDNTRNGNSNAPLSAVPSMILDNFTDPVFIAEPTASPGYHIFIGAGQTSCMTDPMNSSCIGTIVNRDDTIAVSTASDYSQFGSDPSCTMNLEMQQIGNLDRRNPGTIQYSDGSTGTIAGNLHLGFQLVRNFQGDCSSILTALASCYSSGAGCSTDALYWANQIFDLYVRQTGVLRIEDASKIKTLAYLVTFD